MILTEAGNKHHMTVVILMKATAKTEVMTAQSIKWWGNMRITETSGFEGVQGLSFLQSSAYGVHSASYS